MLEEVNIKTSGIRSDQVKKNMDGTDTISLRFWITKKENFHNFAENIELLHPERKQKLDNILSMSRTG